MAEPDNYPRSDEMTPTGQFRAMPDVSQNTAEFRAFTRKYENEGDQPWAAAASGGRSANRTAIMVGVLAVVVVAIVLAVLFG